MASTQTATSTDDALAIAPVAARPQVAMANTDQQRAIAEVQAALFIARTNPRDPLDALDRIKQDCTRPGLAQAALYSYARGGSDISGPSIRLAECIAQRWGNIQFGVREIEQREGESVVQAYAWDVETNTRRETTFTVPHVRDTRKGRVRLEDARDIYEVTANMGARRLRACILGIIPGDVVEAAVEQVEATLHTKADVTPERITKMLELFRTYGVTRPQIEKRIQRKIEALVEKPALFVQLGKIANSIKDGMSSPADWFESEEKPLDGSGQTTVDKVRAKMAEKRQQAQAGITEQRQADDIDEAMPTVEANDAPPFQSDPAPKLGAKKESRFKF